MSESSTGQSGELILAEFWERCPVAHLPPPYQDVPVDHLLRELPADLPRHLAELIGVHGLEAAIGAQLVQAETGESWRPAPRVGRPGQWVLALPDGDSGQPRLLITDRDDSPQVLLDALDGGLRELARDAGCLVLAPRVGDCALFGAARIPALPAALVRRMVRPQWEQVLRWAAPADGRLFVHGEDEERTDIIVLERSMLKEGARHEAMEEACRRLLALSADDREFDVCSSIGADDESRRRLREPLALCDGRAVLDCMQELTCVLEEDWLAEEADAGPYVEPGATLLSYRDLFEEADPETVYPLALRVDGASRVESVQTAVKFSCQCRRARRGRRGSGCPFGPHRRAAHAGQEVTLPPEVIGGLALRPAARRRQALLAHYARDGSWAETTAESLGPAPLTIFGGRLLAGPAQHQLDARELTFMIPGVVHVESDADYVGRGRVLRDPWTSEPLVWLESLGPRPPRHKVLVETHAGVDMQSLTVPKVTGSNLSAQATRLVETLAHVIPAGAGGATAMLVLANLLCLASAPSIHLPDGRVLAGALRVHVTAEAARDAETLCRAVHDRIGLTTMPARGELPALSQSDGALLIALDQHAMARFDRRRRDEADLRDALLAPGPRLVTIMPLAEESGRWAAFTRTLIAESDLRVSYEQLRPADDVPCVQAAPTAVSLPALRAQIARTWDLHDPTATTFDWRPGCEPVMEWIRGRLRAESEIPAAPTVEPLCTRVIRVAVAAARLMPARIDDRVHVHPRHLRWAASILGALGAPPAENEAVAAHALRSVA